MSALTPVHIVSGFLGTGKTTALRDRLSRLTGERVAIIVNDFGVAGIDEASLGESGSFRIANIPGGCVCCTAPEGFVAALGAILADAPDRVMIEPTGLAKPQDLVDTIRRGPHRDRVALQPLLVLVDPTALAGPSGAEDSVVRAQLESADVVVANRCDLASPSDLAAARKRLEALWPTPLAIFWTERGRIPDELWHWPDADAARRARNLPVQRDPHGDHDHAVDDTTLGHRAVSRMWPASDVFSRPALLAALERLRAGEAGAPAIRFKGIFHTQEGWVRVEIAGGRIHDASSAYRRDSRADAIFAAADAGAETRALAWLDAARLTPAERAQLSTQIEIAAADGTAKRVDRGALIALPNGIEDVSVLIPKRQGSAARISALFDALGVPRSGTAVVCASDGFASEPVSLAALAEGVLVHSVDGTALGEKQGGPFRLLIPEGVAGAPSACANVKGVTRIVLRSS
jgi:G3E family GTPase